MISYDEIMMKIQQYSINKPPTLPTSAVNSKPTHNQAAMAKILIVLTSQYQIPSTGAPTGWYLVRPLSIPNPTKPN